MFAGAVPVTKQLILSSDTAATFVRDALIRYAANGLESRSLIHYSQRFQ